MNLTDRLFAVLEIVRAIHIYDPARAGNCPYSYPAGWKFFIDKLNNFDLSLRVMKTNSYKSYLIANRQNWWWLNTFYQRFPVN